MSLGSRKASSLGMTLSSVLDQVAKLPVPTTKEQEEDDVFMLCRCCVHLVSFVQPFVDEARLNAPKSREGNETKASGGQHSTENELQTELLKLWVGHLPAYTCTHKLPPPTDARLFFFSCSCMRTLSYPLLEVQLKDEDTLPVSPLRNFAADILV